MALVAPSLPHHRFDPFDIHQDVCLTMDPSAASVHLVPNPEFVFPARSPTSNDDASPTKRPVSMHLNLSPPSRQRSHQRQSVSTLPTFTFNATDATGLGQPSPPLPSPTLALPTTPSRSLGHRRRASEFVGGDSRYGVSTLVSTSPSKPADILPLPTDQPTTGSPARRRGHAHRRSAAISGHDLASILQPRDANAALPMTSTSSAAKELSPGPSPPLPSSEESLREDSTGLSASAFSPRTSNDVRPFTAYPSTRPRVGFSENIEYIPRPLSTVSSDTASSVSTVRGHSVGNSVSSLISLGGVGTVSPRRSTTPPTMDLRLAPSSGYRSSFESRPTLGPQDSALGNPTNPSLSEYTGSSPNLSIKFDAPDGAHLPLKKKTLRGRLDRRRSEPLIFTASPEQPGVSTVSLHEPVMSGPFEHGNMGHELNRKSSRRKVKDWASAFLGRKTKDPRKTKSMILHSNSKRSSESEPDTPTAQAEAFLDSEPDLDAVFGSDPFGPADDAPGFSFPQACPDVDIPILYPSVTGHDDTEDPNHVIDLDAALGPYGTPSMSGGRRQMHSAGFGKRGLDRGHNRTFSLPALTPFKMDRPSSPVRSAMADVFEEDEEAESAPVETATGGSVPSSEPADSDDEVGTGIQVVDAVEDHEEQNLAWSAERGLGIQGQSAHARSPGSVLHPHSPTSMRRTSVVDDTIIEEASPIDIVGDDEEPRASSVTKSSDSSETPTVLADQHNLTLPVPEATPLTPSSYTASAFSSPDHSYHQGFFDPSRLGTSASSMTDNRTISSFATGDHGLDMRMSVDDVPSLTSSRSTMISSMQHPIPRRDFSDRSGSVVSVPAEVEMMERRRKRSSIQSLSKLVGHPFGDSRTRLPCDQRPQTAAPETSSLEGKKRKENRLSKLMFWRSKGDTRSFSSNK